MRNDTYLVESTAHLVTVEPEGGADNTDYLLRIDYELVGQIPEWFAGWLIDRLVPR